MICKECLFSNLYVFDLNVIKQNNLTLKYSPPSFIEFDNQLSRKDGNSSGILSIGSLGSGNNLIMKNNDNNNFYE